MPLPDRLSILRELEADLEQLTRDFVARGHRVEDARSMALEALVPEGSTLSELSLVHAPAYARLTRRLSSPQLRVLERTAMAVATTLVLAFGVGALIQSDLSGSPSPFLWPVLGLGALLFASIAAKTFELLIKRDHTDPARGLGVILLLSGLISAAAFAGAVVDFYVLASVLERTPELTTTLVLQWLTRDSILLTVAILGSLAGGLTWFVLTQWLAALDAARNEVLGLRPHHLRKGVGS
jgi:hypothetical protein